jgi:hypothetical protein
MALARAADGGVAGHVAHAVEIDREAHGVKPQARRGQGGFDPGVSRAYDRHVASARVISNQLQTPRFLGFIVLFYHPAPAASNTNTFQAKNGKSFFMIILDHPSRESYNYSVLLSILHLRRRMCPDAEKENGFSVGTALSVPLSDTVAASAA